MIVRRVAATALLALSCFGVFLQAAEARSDQETSMVNQAPVDTTAAKPGKITSYTLSPDLYKKAHDRSRIHFRLALIGFAYGLAVLWIILRCKIGITYRDWAQSVSGRRFVQALVFAPLLVTTIAALSLPLDIYSEIVEKTFGISVQSWGSWSWDWVKAQLISLVVFTLLIWLLYAVITRSPKRWWFYFWLVSLPIGVFLVFIGPWVFDPMFHKFEPLEQKDPQLVAALEQMVRRAGENIPPERMFWMGAADKTTALNAYVTGIGASKRIVVFDTTIAKMNTPQIVFVAGHETGHYVLQHIPKGIAYFAVLSLALFYFEFRVADWAFERWGKIWAIRGLDDWASLPLLMLMLSVFMFLANPLASAFSRHLEHQADQFGLEVTHGLTPDSGQVAAQSFQILGEVDLSDPDPNPLGVFLFYTHPTIADRVQFALTYDPWVKGGHGEFVK